MFPLPHKGKMAGPTMRLCTATQPLPMIPACACCQPFPISHNKIWPRGRRKKKEKKMKFPIEIWDHIIAELPDALDLFRVSCANRTLRKNIEDYITFLTRLVHPWKRCRLKTTLAYAFYTQTQSHCRRCGRVATYHKADKKKHCTWCGRGCTFRHSLDTMTTIPYKSNPLWPMYRIPRVALLTGSYSLDRWCTIRGKWDVIGAANTGISIISVLIWMRNDTELTSWARRNHWLMDTVCKTEQVA
jgi:hypothetical protein